ncbi:MAG: 4Fe-4S binding protein [Thermodesulfobacteriota bacterium]
MKEGKILKNKAKELLEKGEVQVVIGYGWGRDKNRTTPVFITDAGEVDKLIFNPLCVNNLSLYYNRKFPDIMAMGKPAIVMKGCDVKSLTVLIQEFQLKREDVVILGVPCRGVVYKQDLWKGELTPQNISPKCIGCDVKNPREYDYLIGEKVNEGDLFEDAVSITERIKALDDMKHDERLAFWREQFDRCIRCYACSKVCPLCYCERCIAEKNMPQWIDTSAHPKGNFTWNLVRAFHLTGRCTFCGECERACPANIPLNLINRKMVQVVKDNLDYTAGYDDREPPPFITYNPDDREEFIK